MKKLLALMLAVMLACGMMSAFAEGTAEPVEGYEMGNKLPDFTVTLSDGESVTLSKLLETKKAVLLNFWYCNCQWCVFEFPFLEEAYEEYADDLAIVALTPYDDDAAITTFKAEMGLTFYMGMDTVGLCDVLATEGYPTSVMIDRNGVICFYEAGAQSSVGAFERLFAPFVADDYTESLVDFEIPPMLPTAVMPDAAVVNAALNAEGGDMVFAADEDVYSWPWVASQADGRDCMTTSNAGNSLTSAYVLTTVNAKAGDALVFDFKVSTSSGNDYFVLYVNDVPAKVFSGVKDWAQYAYTFKADGEYKVAFAYDKGFQGSENDDAVWLDNVRILSGDDAAAAAQQNTSYPLTLSGTESNITPLTEGAKEVIITDPTGMVDSYYAMNKYYIIPADEATFCFQLGNECDPDAAYAYSYYDGASYTAADCEQDADGFVFKTVADSMETSGYSWCAVATYPVYNDYETGVFSVMFFRSEENANAFCQSDAGEGTTWAYADGTAPSTDALPGAAAATDASYTLTFVDQNGDAVPGVIANVCDDSTCTPMTADENGVVAFRGAPYEYDIHVLKVPEGYSFDTTQAFKAPLEGGEMSFTLTKN